MHIRHLASIPLDPNLLETDRLRSSHLFRQPHRKLRQPGDRVVPLQFIRGTLACQLGHFCSVKGIDRLCTLAGLHGVTIALVDHVMSKELLKALRISTIGHNCDRSRRPAFPSAITQAVAQLNTSPS